MLRALRYASRRQLTVYRGVAVWAMPDRGLCFAHARSPIWTFGHCCAVYASRRSLGLLDASVWRSIRHLASQSYALEMRRALCYASRRMLTEHTRKSYLDGWSLLCCVWFALMFLFSSRYAIRLLRAMLLRCFVHYAIHHRVPTEHLWLCPMGYVLA
jgi:hypothetical protein